MSIRNLLDGSRYTYRDYEPEDTGWYDETYLAPAPAPVVAAPAPAPVEAPVEAPVVAAPAPAEPPPPAFTLGTTPAEDDPLRNYWAWNDPRWGGQELDYLDRQYRLDQFWNPLLEATGFDMSKALRPSGKMVSYGEGGQEWEGQEYTPEYYKAIDDLRAQGYDIRQENPDLWSPSKDAKFAVIGPGNKILKDITVEGSDFGDFLKEAILTLGPMALQIIPGVGQALGPLGNALLQGGITALKGGDLEDVLKSAAISGGISYATPYIKDLGSAVSEAVGGDTLGKIASGAVTGAAKSGLGALISGTSIEDALLSGGTRGLIGAGTGAFKDTISDYLKSDVTAEGLEDLFGGLGVDETVNAEQYVEPVAAFPEDFGYVPEQTLPAIESDYSVAQTPTGPRIVDAAGNLGDFDSSGRFVTDTEFMGPSISTKNIATAPNEKINIVHPLPKQDIFIPDWDRPDVIIPDWDVLPLPIEEPDRTPGRPEDTSPRGGTIGREDEVTAPTPAPAPAPSPPPAPAPAPAASRGSSYRPSASQAQQWQVLGPVLAGAFKSEWNPYLLGKVAQERIAREQQMQELMSALGMNPQA